MKLGNRGKKGRNALIPDNDWAEQDWKKKKWRFTSSEITVTIVISTGTRE